MKAEIYREIENENKANASEILCVLLNNAITYMYEQGMNKEEITDYIGCNIETLDAIENNDFAIIAKEG